MMKLTVTWHTQKLCHILMVFCLALSVETIADSTFDPGLAPFKIKVGARSATHNIIFRTVLPGESLTLSMAESEQFTVRDITSDKTIAITSTHGSLVWKAPAIAGHTPLIIENTKTNATIQLQLLVIVPANKVVNGKLNGYQIGNYPPPLKGLDAYKAPSGYIEVTKALTDLAVSPHFTLGQFLCKQQSSSANKYVVLRPKLLEKLEFLLSDVNQQGIRTDSFVIMSGYRTPYYNKAIANVANSRHIYGGAADIFIDVKPKNYYMDDLNGDGKTDAKDAAYLYTLADKYVKKTGKTDLAGGVGEYKSTSTHGPFVHIDVRGSQARWGH